MKAHARTTPAEPCPCGRPASYENCCGRYHAGPLALQAPDPESLMRSRYTAFVKNVSTYLLDTWCAADRPAAIEAPEPGLKWLGLTVKEARLLGPGEGLVTFVARYKLGGRAHRMQECSRFVLDQGRWLYAGEFQADQAGCSEA